MPYDIKIFQMMHKTLVLKITTLHYLNVYASYLLNVYIFNSTCLYKWTYLYKMVYSQSCNTHRINERDMKFI